MRFVQAEGNAVELNTMWLPTWLGHNAQLKRQLEQELAPRFVGKPLTDEVLEEAHQAVLEFIQRNFKIEGLFDYLDGIKFVEM